jgi:hypothetical protein
VATFDYPAYRQAWRARCATLGVDTARGPTGAQARRMAICLNVRRWLADRTPAGPKRPTEAAALAALEGRQTT